MRQLCTSPGLLTDLYQFNMMQAYLENGMAEPAVFELFFRKLPPTRGFLVTAGLEQVLDYLEMLRFSEGEIAWLRQSGHFSSAFLDYLVGFRFSGDVRAMPEGTICFADEPVIQVVAPLAEAQFVESRLLNLIHFQTVVASKAARMILAAPGKQLIDFGFRRAHGEEAGLLAARAAYVAGFAGTATVAAGRLFEIPLHGTMAHSFVQAHESEIEAFEHFARSRPDRVVLLIDTYDTEAGARTVASLAPRLAERGIRVAGVRIDSGDLGEMACRVRKILDAAGLREVSIVASGGLDENSLQHLTAADAPIDVYGIGTSLTTASDAPALDCAYKLQEYAGIARRKRSAGKATWPGRKQVYRSFDAERRMRSDLLTTDEGGRTGTPLLQTVMRDGRRTAPSPSLDELRRRVADALAQLPEPLYRLEAAATYQIEVDERLRRLADAVDERNRLNAETDRATHRYVAEGP